MPASQTQQFAITVDQVGHGTIHIGDEDVSNDIAGFELVAAAGQVTQLILHQRPNGGTVHGEGLIQAAEVPRSNVAAVVQAIPPAEIRKEAESDLYNDMNSDLYQSARDAIVRILSR